MNINSYKKEIIKEFSDKFYKITGGDFEKFLEKNESSIWDLFKKIYEDKSLYLTDFLKKNYKSKKRWIKSELEKDSSPYFKKINTATQLYNELKGSSKESIFEDIYFCKNPEELIKKSTDELIEWKTRDSYFIDFPYIKYKRTTAIYPAICNDVIVYLLNIADENIKEIVKVPLMLKEIPEDTTNKIKALNEDNLIEEETISKQIYFDDVTGEEVSLTLAKNEYLSFYSKGGAVTELDIEIRNEIIKQLKIFNSLDRAILQYLIQQKEEIYKADRIERTIDDITISLGKKNTKANRDAVTDSLSKLGSSGYSKNGKFVGRFFALKIEPIKEGKREKKIAYIYIDGMLREVLLSNATFNFYAESFNLLSKDAQKILIILQSERMIRVVNNNPDLYDVKSFSYFKKAIYFTNKRTMKQRILSALDELVQYKMGIKDYHVINKYEVKLEYFKFQEEDIKLITGENFKYGDFVDGRYDVIV